MSCSTRCSIARDRSPGTDQLDQNAGLQIRLRFETIEDHEPFATQVFERHLGGERIDGVGGLNLDDPDAQRARPGRFGRRKSAETRDCPVDETVECCAVVDRCGEQEAGNPAGIESDRHEPETRIIAVEMGIGASGRGLEAGNFERFGTLEIREGGKQFVRPVEEMRRHPGMDFLGSLEDDHGVGTVESTHLVGDPDHDEVFRHLEGEAPLRVNVPAAPDVSLTRALPESHVVDHAKVAVAIDDGISDRGAGLAGSGQNALRRSEMAREPDIQKRGIAIDQRHLARDGGPRDCPIRFPAHGGDVPDLVTDHAGKLGFTVHQQPLVTWM